MDFNKVWLSTIFGLIAVVISDKGEFECPGKANCICSRGITGDYELLCPKTLRQPSLIVRVQPKKYVQVQCTVTKSQNGDLNLVGGLEIGPVNTFMLRLCPLPTGSFKELMSIAGVPSIKTLQVQSHGNLSDSLTRAHLGGLSHVSQINFASNALTNIPEDLFFETTNLTWLDMKDNNLNLPKNIFRPISKLEVLELGANNLTYLEPGIFRNLTKLRLLNLWSNRLKNLSRSLFSDLPNLENLDLNSNRLVTLPPDLFADLNKLKTLNLNGNDFFSIPQGLFLSNPNLEKIQLHNNRRSLRTLPPSLFANLTHLKEVYLNDCNLTHLPEDLLWGSVLLINLTLQKNLLIELPPQLLKDNPDLQTIDLSQNRLTNIPDTFFSAQDKLTHLNLSNNQLKNISQYVFSNLGRLEVLHLENNKIEYISPQAFQVTIELRHIHLTNNRLSVFYAEYTDPTFGRHSLLQSSVNLETVSLANNSITEIFSDWRISMTRLEVLDLSYNQLTNLTIEDLQFVATKLTVDLSFNNITHIKLDNAESVARMRFAKIPTDRLENTSARVVLRGNPLTCDCQAFNLVRFLRGELDHAVEYIVDFDVTNFTCHSPKAFQNQIVRALDPSQLTCPIKSGNCPKNCTCHYKPASLGHIIDCSYKNLTMMPAELPVNKEISEHTNHTELIMVGNQIKKLPLQLGPGYDRVTELYLAENNLTHINISLFSSHIEVIELHQNNLSQIDVDSLKMLEKAKKLRYLTLHQNPWSCDCSAKDFLNFIHTNFKKVMNYGNITCSGGTTLTNLTESALCPISLGMDIGIGMSLVAIVGFLICVSIIFYYKYQREIRVWLYAHGLCLWFVTEEELDKDKIYDAFVSYSHQDEGFVVSKLVPGLENGSTKYKLCLHYRDWIVGDFIPNQIARSVEESRRTVVILSPNFIESVWGRMEFRAAHSKALSEGRARVIVVLYGDLGDTELLDPELKAYLSMNTYVKWGDPWFWEKIRYAMPHPPGLSKGLPLILKPSTKRSTANEKLVSAPIEMNGTTTPPADVILDPLTKISKPA